MEMAMTAPKIAQQVYRAHVDHFGEPDESVVYEDADPSWRGPARVDVLVWMADDDCDITTLSTVGMCTVPMANASHRAELHFAVRRSLSEDEWRRCSLFLANLVTYPFHYNTHVDWWHRIRRPGDVPLFPSASAVLFHPRFVSEGWDSIETDGATVKLLNVVPLVAAEAEVKPVSAILDLWAGAAVDVFRPR